MKKDMDLENIRQKFEGSVVMFGKRPVLFNKIAGDMSCRIFDLMDQEEKQVAFDDTFHPPAPRIGMVNIGGSVVYVSRIPIRRYKLGLSGENIRVQSLGVPYPEKGVDQEVARLKSKSLGNALLGKYPTKMQAMRKLTQFHGAVAFDKQFCVDSEGGVWYKIVRVGHHNFSELFLDDQFKHLEILLDKRYEKSFRTV